VPLGVDVLKAEFPVDTNEETDPAIWHEACSELTQASGIPWVLLSAGASWDLFLRQAEVACHAGASGVMAGRALWNEAITTDRPFRQRFLENEARQRLHQLRALCDSHARPLSRLLQPG
jgi:tagatose-1,6-bisphosphate aldolase